MGLIIVKKDGNVWHVDTFLMSCRVIGRRLEDVLAGEMLHAAQKEGVEKILGEYIPTSKNEPAKDAYQNLGFEKDGNLWRHDVQKGFTIPNFFKIEEEHDEITLSNFVGRLGD